VIKQIVPALILFYFLACALLLLFKNQLIYRPSSSVRDYDLDSRFFCEDVGFSATDGCKISGRYISFSAPAKGVILFCHGNAGNLGDREDSVSVFLSLGFHVLIFDYRGYGNSKGFPSPEGTAADVAGAFQWLKKKGYEAEDILLWGRSLGGAVAVQLARVHAPGALVLESTFSSLKDIAAHFYPWLPVKYFPLSGYGSIDSVSAFTFPVLVIHSKEDDVIPYEFGRKLYEAVPSSVRSFLEISGSHNTGHSDSEQKYKKGIKDFLDTYWKKQ
jgi:fermentation-respiration switch protein FrsA (DUF1100 family)